MSQPVYLSSLSRSRRESPARSLSPARGAGADVLAGMFADRATWVFLLAAIVVFAIIWWIVYDHHAQVHAWARIPSWIANPFILGVVVFVCVLLVAYATKRGYSASAGTWKNVIGGVFFVVGVALIAIAHLVYRSHNFVAAFWVALVVAVLVLVHFYAVWVHDRQAAMAVLPFLFVLLAIVYLLWYMADESQSCLNVCAPVYEATA